MLVIQDLAMNHYEMPFMRSFETLIIRSLKKTTVNDPLNWHQTMRSQ